MPTETLPAEDMAKAEERLKGIIGAPVPGNNGVLTDLKPAKRTRSDKGTKRPEKPKPAPAGVLTEEQGRELWGLADALQQAYDAMRIAQFKYAGIKDEFQAHIAKLTGK